MQNGSVEPLREMGNGQKRAEGVFMCVAGDGWLLVHLLSTLTHTHA